MNGVLLIFNFIAALGISTDRDTVMSVYWSHGKVDRLQNGEFMDVYVGVAMRVDAVDCAGAVNTSRCMTFYEANGFEADGQVMYRDIEWSDDEACSRNGGEVADACEDCKGAAIAETTLIIGVITQLPTIFTDLQRATRWGDTHCQSTMGVLTNVVSWYATITALASWNEACYANLSDTILNSPVDWSLGFAFSLLFISTLCKLIDAAAHLIVPSPQRGPLNKEIEFPDYLNQACKDTSTVPNFGEGAVCLGRNQVADTE